MLSAAGEPAFDREKNASLEVIIRAFDGGIESNMADITVTLNIQDINDNRPVFNTTIPGRVDIDEDVSIGTHVLRVTATDKDTEEHGNIVYTISAGNNEGKFDVDPTTVSDFQFSGPV